MLNKRVKTVKVGINLSLKVKERPLKQNGFKLSSESHSVCYFSNVMWEYANKRPLCRSRSFKVTDFGTNEKLACDCVTPLMR